MLTSPPQYANSYLSFFYYFFPSVASYPSIWACYFVRDGVTQTWKMLQIFLLHKFFRDLSSFFRKICLNLRTFFRNILLYRDFCTYLRKICHNLHNFSRKICFCRDFHTFFAKLVAIYALLSAKFCCPKAFSRKVFF